MAVNEYNNFLVRLTPKVRELLDAAHKDLEMPRAHIINNALKKYLERYNATNIDAKLNRMTK